MRISLKSLVIILALLSFGYAQERFDILHYEIFIDLFNGLVSRNGFYSGYSEITFKALEDLDNILLHAGKNTLAIDSIIFESSKLNFYHFSDSLLIYFSRQVHAGDTTRIKIYFQRHSNLDLGFYFYRSDEVSPPLPSDIAYTMTEPSDSRYWFPCFDEPRDKATVDVILRVKENFLVASNGLLIRDEILNDGSRIFHWSSKHPMATYLIAFATSEYITFSDWYHKVTNPNEVVEIKYYVWRVDSLQAVNAFRNVVDMMRFFSSKFGEYPFEKYGMVAIQPFRYGGMEHQTITTINRQWLYGNYEGGIAHELAHQWWGDLVTCRYWSDIWLNEGFASYSDALYTEYKYGRESFLAKLSSWANAYFREDSLIRYPIYNPPPARLFGTAVYLKGAWVLHMLRNLLSDSTFFSALREWGRRFAYESATTEDFINVVSDVSGKDMRWFFEQWVYGAGYPVFSLSVNFLNSDGQKICRVNVMQVQKNLPVFSVPLEFRFWNENFDTTLAVWNFSADTVYEFKFENLVGQNLNFAFDPENKVLKKVQSPILLTKSDNLPEKFRLYQNYPNPFNSSTKIRFDIPKIDGILQCEVELFDVLGRRIERIISGEVTAGSYEVNFNGDNIPSGVYFYELRVKRGEVLMFREMKKMVVLK